MEKVQQNYYGSLCTEMYEILHSEAPRDEFNFYLSYAKEGMKILEPMCGSGRFLVPFLKLGLDITGIDLSREMLDKLKEKVPKCQIVHEDILKYETEEKYDYIFISSGSVSLFTDMNMCQKILLKIKSLLKQGGKFVFAVDTIADRCLDDTDYKIGVSVKTKEGYDLILKGKNTYDEITQTQYSPSFYELYDQDILLQQEFMDFQTHLYKLGELDQYLHDIGFSKVIVYSSFDKDIALNNETEMFLYECTL